MLFAHKSYKGLPAQSRREIQTHCHLRGNLYRLGEEWPPIKDTESLADILAGLRGKHEKQSSNRAGPKGCPSHKLSSSLSSSEDLAGGQAGGQHPRRRLPESDLVADRDGAKNSDEAWRQCHARAPRHPFRLGDIAEAGLHGPDVLLLIPLKLRDGENAFSSYRPPLASIVLASEPKETRPPSPGAGHGRRKETLQNLGKARSKSRESWRGKGVPGPLFIATSSAKS